MSELWEVVEGRESDNWGVRKKGENYGKSIAQMLWEEDAREIVELHNRASLTSAAEPGENLDESLEVSGHYAMDDGYCSCGVLCETGTRFRQHLDSVKGR